MTALDDRIFVLLSQWSENIAKFDSELKFTYLKAHFQYRLVLTHSL